MTKPWYHKGLPFKCTGCGKCCTGAPGYVWTHEEEIKQMAEYLHLSAEQFVQKYVRKVGSKLSLLEHSKTYDCVFLKGKECTIYPVRPKQCKTFPWWKENIESKESWNEAGKACEGINHPEAPLISIEEIEKELL